MKKPSRLGIIIYVATVIISAIFVFAGNRICMPEIFDNSDEEYYRAKVLEVGETKVEEFSLDDGATTVTNKNILFTALIKSGPYKGESITCVQSVDSMYAYQPRDVKAGDSVLVSLPGYEIEGSDADWIFIEHNRMGTIYLMCGMFLLLILLIGRLKGLSTIISLMFTVLAIFLVYIPAILKGFNVYIMTLIVGIFIIFMSLIIINGWNKKTLCAIVGNIIGVAVSGVLAHIMSRAFGLTGIVDEDYVLLTLMDTPIDLKAIVWGGVLIGSLGAIMDIAMSIASAMKELNDTMRDKTFVRMLKSGMNIGRDAIGTMTNTLILAYIGGALATVLLLVAYNKNILYLFNMEMIIAELLSAIVGSMGILAAVPATALFSAYVYNRKKDREIQDTLLTNSD